MIGASLCIFTLKKFVQHEHDESRITVFKMSLKLMFEKTKSIVLFEHRTFGVRDKYMSLWTTGRL